jgi:CRP-like cAMP-binding protein/HEAT repeat protein
MDTNKSSRAAIRLQRVLNVRPEEWRVLVFLYALALVLLTGITWGETIVVAAFLQRVGVSFLPWAFVISALASVAGLFVYAGFSDRVGDRPLFVGLLGVSVAGVLLGLVLLGIGQAVVGYLILFLVLNVALTDAFNAHWATYVNGFYDTRAAKRIVPVLSTATRVSGILAGLTMPLINRVLSPTAVIAVWLVALVASGALVWLQPRWVRAPGAPGTVFGAGGRTAGSEAKLLHEVKPSYWANLREGYEYVTASPFLRILALSTLLVAVWLALVIYRASGIFLDSLQTTVAIANFVGVLGAVANIVALPIQLLLLGRLIGRAGLGNASLIFPAGAGIVSVGLLAAPGLALASLAHIARTTFRTAFRNPIDSLLYNAVPRRVKGRARAFMGGLIFPLGALIGGLLLFTPLADSPVALGALIVGLAAGIVVTAFGVRRQYARALVRMLEQEDFSPMLALQGGENGGDLLVADPATTRALKSKLETSDSPEMTLFLARLFAEVAGKDASPVIAEVARRAEDVRMRAALVDVLTAAGAQDDAARALYADMLDDPGAQARRSALAGLAQDSQWTGGGPAARVARLLDDPSIEVREEAVRLLLRGAAGQGPVGGETPAGAAGGAASEAMSALARLLDDGEPQARVSGIRILSEVWPDNALPRLVQFAQDSADEVRLEAALGLERALALEGSALQTSGRRADAQGVALGPARSMLKDPMERVRQAGAAMLAAMARQNGRTAPGPQAQAALSGLLEALADSSAEVRQVAIDGLAAGGRGAIAIVHPQLNSPHARVRRSAAMILGRVEPRQYTGLVESHINGDLLTIYRNVAASQALQPCDAEPSAQMLREALLEQNASLRDGLFALLAAVQDEAAVSLVREMCGSPSEHARANAAETLEAMTSPRIATLVAPLYDPDVAAEGLLQLSHDAWNLSFRSPEAALEDLVAYHPDEWMRGIAGVSLARLTDGAEATRPASAPQEGFVLSVIDKIILMKEVPFFQGMTIEQMRVLASVCEEQFVPADSAIVQQGDPGGALYVIVSGKVAIEQEKALPSGAKRGSAARLATLGAHNYFGEINLFDGTPHSAAAVTLQDTQLLRLRKEPLIALARQHPELSLALIGVLSQRLRDANDRIADLTRSKPRELRKLYDAFD